jgi:hypothetical protein
MRHMNNDPAIRTTVDAKSTATGPRVVQPVHEVDHPGCGTVIRQFDAYGKPPRIARPFDNLDLKKQK